ncbi:MAG: alpha-amylase family glycosyl hydrolase [Myxococcota bacterium]
MRVLAPLALLLLQGCKSCAEADDYTRLYHTEPIAPGLDEGEVRALEHLGPTLVEKGVNFSVFAGRAERVDLLLFDDPDASEPIQRWEMSSFDGVWNLYVEGVGSGTMYGYVAWGSNWPFDADWYCGSQRGFVADVDEHGNRYNPNKLLFDPWSRALTRDHDWLAGSAGTGESRRAQCTWGAAAKSVVMESKYEWSEGEAAWRAARADGTAHGWNELILYEAHPKGLTANGREDVDHPGTFRGIGEMASYFSALGITAVELLPVHEKPLDGGYWGYNNVSFFAPELTYSADWEYGGPPEAVIDEFKWMVDQLHQQDIEVILDVVYNHTGEGGLWRDKIYTDDSPSDADAVYDAYNLDTVEAATIFHFRGLDNWAYYALSEDNQTYWNNTGVGNETRPNYAPGRRMVMDSLHFLVEELHVDGFRFDLAGILGERDEDYNNWDDPANTVLQDIIDDPVLQAYNTRIIAEPWTAGGSYTSIGAFPASSNKDGTGWGEWNASFRDWWREIVNDDDWTMNSAENGIDGGGVITGSYDRYAWNGRKPYHTTNFVTSHDGFTMYDLLSYDEKQNLCSVLNPTCCDDPYSVWCDTDSGESNNRSRDWGMDAEGFKRQLMRDFFVGMMISHGTPMILGGDEWLRTQYGNNNAYSTAADNEWNWFRWGEWQAQDERWRMFDFVSKMTRFRLDHAYALSPLEWGAGMPLAWKDATNSGDPDWSSRHLMMHYYDDDGTWEEPELAILINMERSDVTFTLPSGRTWGRVVDTQEYFDGETYLSEAGIDTRVTGNYWTEPTVISDGVYTVPGSTIVILEEQ